MRLDIYITNSKMYETRNKSKTAILSGYIYVNNELINKPNYLVKDTDIVEKKQQEEYVSRGAYKLLKAIEEWHISFKNKVILDIGASTGGFTDLCLKNGAKHVYAVDVGSNQLHYSLINNARVMSLEHRHFNSLSNNMFKFKIDYVVADLSFISLTKLIDKLISLFSYKYKCVFLIKPQFELSPNEIKNGKPIKNTLLKKAVEKIVMYAQQNNFKVMGVVKSPIKGSKKENTEFLIYMEHN